MVQLEVLPVVKMIRLLTTGCQDVSSFCIRLWSLHSYTNVVAYKGHNFPVWDLDISPRCLYFATGSQDRTARLWNLEYTYPLRIFAGHLQDVDVSKNARYRVQSLQNAIH
ncbi:Transcription initiation factor TFIID subunit 5 [Desmophyllum pertusum]|uniref:Transcription initiation factor TFIID subunit 5 n=1 Tax=Desmophyllum pertusum TaxID=174260 RepID=A0A9X0D189_9CNID|nr:Transcription initiation factor TFIID subunit 5 [Desmophyllum pertusum]